MKKKIIIGISFVFVVGANLYFRSFPIDFPQLKKQAGEIILKSGEQMTAQEVYKKFPQFYPSAKDKIIKSRLTQYQRQNKQVIEKQVREVHARLKDKFQDQTGQTYIMELDCWHWARYVENVARFGRPGDETIYGKQWDLYMTAPLGFYMIWDQFLFYFSAYIYKAFCIFYPMEIYKFLFYLPLFFAFLFVVALYFFAYRYAGMLGAVASCLFIGLAPIFLHRSCAGWFDKDILNLLFPLLALWAYVRAEEAVSLKRKMPWVLLSAFWVGIFCFNWTFWWFIFLIIIAYEALSLAYLAWGYVYRKRKETRPIFEHGVSLAAFTLFSLAFILAIAGTQPLSFLYKQFRLALVLNKPLLPSIWPNVLSTVGELRALGIAEMANSCGGKLLFGASLICLLWLMSRASRDKEYPVGKRAGLIMLALWFVTMAYASLRGVRFLVFLLIPLGICLGWAANEAYELARKRKDATLKWAVLALFIIFCGSSTHKAYKAASGMFPLIDDTWYQVLHIIRDKTPEQAILNSWWDFGDWFKVIARRRVIFDGQSQDTPQAYWMAKAILSDDERKAMRILRMLNNGGNKAFEILDEHMHDPLQAVLFLEKLLVSSAEDARQSLLELLPVPAAEQMMNILFGTPSRACFIVDYTMVPKMGAISYLGNWDFSKVYIAQNMNRQEKNQIIERLRKLGRTDPYIQTFYQEASLISRENLDDWLSHRLNFYSPLHTGREKDGVVFFENGFAYDLKEGALSSNSGQIPRSVFALKDNNFTEEFTKNPNVPFSLLIAKVGEEYKCIMLDRELAGSLFVRLYFFNGLGMRHFAPFIDTEEGNNYIRVFNIIW